MQEPSFSVAPFATESPQPHQTVTCAATSSKFVVLGLSDGSVSLYDVFGNRLDHHASLHTAAVTAVALGGGPAADQIVASAAADGHIRVARLFSGKATTPELKSQPRMLSAAIAIFTKQAEASVTAVAVDPSFGKPRFGERIAYADVTGRVAIYTAGWFGGSEFITAPASNTPVTTISWFHNLIAFPAPNGVRVYDTKMNRMVCVVAPPGSSVPTSPMSNITASPSLEQSLSSLMRRPLSPQPQQPLSGKNSSLTRSVSMDVRSGASSSTMQSTPPRLHASQTAHGIGLDHRWAMHNTVFMDEDPDVPASSRGEPTARLYVTWPSGARIVRIGPPGEHTPTAERPSREISVIFKLNRAALYPSMVPEIPPRPPPVHEAPLLALVPFGHNESVALVGTPSKILALHLISEDGKSVKNMLMPQRTMRDAHLLTVPGGDPLVLIVAHPDAPPAELSDTENTSQIQSHVADVIYVRSLTTAERVKWLLGQNRFHDALNVAQSAPGGSLRRAEVSIEDVGDQFLDSLKDTGDYSRLASVLPETISTTTPYIGFRARDKVMSKRKRRWERWIESFRESNETELIAPVVPTYEPCLDKETYNRILVELSASNPAVMLEILNTWPTDVYSVSTVTQAIEKQLGQSNQACSSSPQNGREPLREGLLMMYGLSGRHDETLNLLLREKSPKVYDYIRSHHLFEAVRSQETITGLYSINSTEATETLSKAPETVLPPDAVVPILTKINNSEWMYMYLHAVFRGDPDQAPKYHNQLLKLYVEHGKPGYLFSFLRTSTHYSLDRALQEMGGPKGKKKGYLAKERVFVLSAMGDLNSAMHILLDELGDTLSAIEFASDHGDSVLWERLIEHARTHADTLAALLDSPAGGKVDPVRLIPLLNSEMRIPHLRDRLHGILVDAALERALREDAAAALHHDANELLQKLDECVTVLP